MTIDSITQLATNQKIQALNNASKPLLGTTVLTDIDALAGSLSNKSILLTLDGKTKSITFNTTFFTSPVTGKTSTELKDSLQALVNGAFGSNNAISININSDKLSFIAPGSKLTVNSVGTDTTTLESLGFVNNQSNKINLSGSLQSVSLLTPLDLASDFTFKINSVDFTISKTDSIASVIDKINSSNAGVTLAYSSISDKFSIIANQSGAGSNIVMSESSGNLLSAFGLTTGTTPNVTNGINAELSVNGQPIVRSSNTIEIDGLKLTISKTSNTAITLDSKRDSSALVAPIKKFVEDYNTMIESMSKSIKETVYKDFQPLSDKQKADMSETEIKTWEEKSKSGILRGDTILRGITSKLQSAISSLSINGTSLYSLGITSAGYMENGKLKIDETKLKVALDSNATGVKDLFSSENGLANTLNNIITAAIKTSGPKGTRGSLVEAAGIDSTSSDTENFLTDNITRTTKTIATLQTRLKAEETRLWSKFTAMEQALQQLNSQSSYISQFSAG